MKRYFALQYHPVKITVTGSGHGLNIYSTGSIV